MTSNNLPYINLARQLESIILSGHFRSGEKLPSLCQLAKHYQLKNNIVQRALKVLVDKGLIEAIPGNGYYVAQASLKNKTSGGERQLTVIQHHSSDFDTITYSSVALTGIQQEAAKLGIGLNIHYAVSLNNWDNQLPKLLERVSRDSDAVILLGTFDFKMDAIEHCSCPIVGISMHQSYRNQLSVISLDPFAAADLAVDYFRREKIRKVRAFLHRVDEQQIRLECFRRLWDGELEIKEYSSIDPIESGDYPADYPESDGYWFAGGTLAEWHAREFRRRSLESMADVRKVIAIDGKSIFNPSTYQPMNNIAPDWKLAGKLAVAEAMRRLDDPGSGPLRQYLSVRFEALPEKTT